MTTPTLNDGSQNAPALRVYLNLGTLGGLPEWSVWHTEAGDRPWLERIRADGFDGIQGGDPKEAAAAGLGIAAGGRVDRPEDAGRIAAELKAKGFPCATVHVGRGFEEDAEMDALGQAIVAASVEHDFPLYIETHRATLTQDIWRTVRWIERCPGVRINADFSHYYTGHEMVYGKWDEKMAFMGPIFERVRFMHGRIGSPGAMQVDIGDGVSVPQELGRAFVADFREMWTRSMVGFLRTAKPGDYLVFAPELLVSSIYYARAFPDTNGVLREEGDRYAQARIYAGIARECFAAAEAEVAGT